MTLLSATNFFAVGGTGFNLVVLIFLVLIVGLYLWGSSRKIRKGKADQLQETYRVMTGGLLASVPDEELVDAVAANLLAKLDKRKPDAYKTIPLLSRGRCAVYGVWLTGHELESGSLYTYLHSPSGRFVSLAADGYELVGAPECAAVLRAAVEELHDEERLMGFQERFRSAAEKEKPMEGCVRYIRENPGEFLDVAETSSVTDPGRDTFAE